MLEARLHKASRGCLGWPFALLVALDEKSPGFGNDDSKLPRLYRTVH